MPIYEYRCQNGHKFERVLPLAQYDSPVQCDCGAAGRKIISLPLVRGDLPDYVSPVTGKVVSGRVARREDLKRSGCVEYDPGIKREQIARKKASDERLEKSLDEHVEASIDAMPVRKRELLYQELQSGVSAEYNRK